MFPLYAKLRFSWSETQIGLFMGLAFGAVLVATQWLLIGRLARIAGEVGLTIIGLALLAAGTLGVSLAYSTPLLTVTTVLLAIGAGLAFPAFTSLFSRVCGAHEAGEVLSQSQAMVHMGRTLGALCWGWVLHTLGTGAPFVVSALATLGALAIFVLAGRILLPR
jgi:MFS family permease